MKTGIRTRPVDVTLVGLLYIGVSALLVLSGSWYLYKGGDPPLPVTVVFGSIKIESIKSLGVFQLCAASLGFVSACGLLAMRPYGWIILGVFSLDGLISPITRDDLPSYAMVINYIQTVWLIIRFPLFMRPGVKKQGNNDNAGV